MQSDEIVLSITKPESEWVRGRAVQKVSQKRDHGRVQAELVAALVSWARGRGEVATEWRFRVQPRVRFGVRTFPTFHTLRSTGCAA
jgi:hypothetical protein